MFMANCLANSICKRLVSTTPRCLLSAKRGRKPVDAEQIKKRVFKLERSNARRALEHDQLDTTSSETNKYSQTNHNNNDNNNSPRTNKYSLLSTLPPVNVEPENDVFNQIGEQFSGRTLHVIRNQMLDKLNDFFAYAPARELAKSHNIDENIFTKAFVSFRRYCYKSASLPPELHIKICDIIDDKAHISDLFPYFLSHAKEAFPHLDCTEELKKISDLGLPHSWYPEAREKTRKIIFHAGPTNSGKTYHALKRLMNAKSGIYCGPLKLLASEVYHKMNDNNVPCDLITGDERRYANPDGTPANHVACTVDMCQVIEPVEVAVIDEIQMLKDPTRGSSWTRALLGVLANEVHLCGEEAATDLIKWITVQTGDLLQIVKYKRLGKLIIQDEPLESLKNVKPGDCIVVFNKDDLYRLTLELEKQGMSTAVVYGSLPPGAKKKQCDKFNSLDDSCKYMVATDAIGMGLNLKIRRVIFYRLDKVQQDNRGNKFKDDLTVSHCKQIAGRAGRYIDGETEGFVTTYRVKDLDKLKEIMSRPVPPLKVAGLQPTVDQIELFAYHLPNLDLSDLIELFVDLCEYDPQGYFICDMEQFKTLADLIQHIPIPLRSRFMFCQSPIDLKSAYTSSMFVKFVTQYSRNEPLTANWVLRQIEWPLKLPTHLDQLTHLERVFDVLELYLWLSYRFPLFSEPDTIREVQQELDKIIHDGVSKLNSFIRDKMLKKNDVEGMNSKMIYESAKKNG